MLSLFKKLFRGRRQNSNTSGISKVKEAYYTSEQEAREMKEWSSEQWDAFGNKVSNLVKENPLVHEMSQSEEKTIRNLKHPDPVIRARALNFLDSRWPAPPNFRAICEDMALADADSHVRAMAICSLRSLYFGTKDERMAKLLAAMVEDRQLDDAIRQAACLALAYLAPPSGEVEVVNGKIEYPDPDWTFVESFLPGSREGI
jgi:hypothetical protein